MTSWSSSSGNSPGPRDGKTAGVLFVGIGTMGMPMADRLSAAGHMVTARDVDQAAVVRWNDTHKAVMQTANIAVLMLPSSQVVEAVLEGPGDDGGLLDELPRGAVIVDMGEL